jgi:type I restriction enzyme S subunit
MAIGGTPLRCKNEYYENGRHVWVSVSELHNNVITDSKEYINDEGVKHSNVKLVKKGSILMSFKLSIGKCAIAGVDLYTNEAIVAWHSNDETVLSNQYLYYYLSTRDFSDSGKGSLGAGSMNKGSLSELTMHLPPIAFQQAVLTRLDALQSQLTALENLGKQAEDNARFILESYLGSTSPMPTAQSSDAHSSSCKADKDGVGCTCPTSRSQIVEDEDEKDEKSKHLEPAVEEKAAQASGGSRDLTETELAKKYLPELKEIAKSLDVKFPSKINKGELIQSILKKQAGK